MSNLVRYPPLPIRDDLAPSYLKARGDANRDFAFHLADAQGTYPRPPGFHGAVDWFAPAGTPVKSPAPGVVTRTVPGGDSSGPVFGGIVEVTEPTGVVWVMRHVSPKLAVGAEVQAGDVVAAVHEWRDGGEHLHLECWKSKAGGYAINNMVDPKSFVWDEAAAKKQELPQRAQFWMEELPHTAGGSGPVVMGGTTPDRAEKLAENLRKKGEMVSTIRGLNDLVYALTWKSGTYGDRYRFGPWETAEQRDAVASEREQVTGRTMRRFKSQVASLYPWPTEA